MPEPTVAAAVERAHDRDRALVLAATARFCRSLDLAEDSVQEAYAEALTAWSRDGIPRNPAAWLTTTARRRATDSIRRERTLRLKLPLLVVPDDERQPEPPPHIADDRLRLMFLCCHPALAPDAQVALMLRLVCGLATRDIARLFLVAEATMAARVTRAKHKIAVARIPFRVPNLADLPQRTRAVLTCVHLLHTAGHVAPGGADLVDDEAAGQALRLAGLLRELLPDDAETAGLLALLLATQARRTTRTGEGGLPVRLQDQDRSRWDAEQIERATDLLRVALPRPDAGRFALQAAIAVLHARAPRFELTDWPQILGLYDRLLEVWPSPVVAVNRAVAVGMVDGAHVALAELDRWETDPRLAGYHYRAAVRADLLESLGETEMAVAGFREAAALATNESERRYLAERAAQAGRRVRPTDGQQLRST